VLPNDHPDMIGWNAPIAVVRRTSVTGKADSVHSPMLC